ncbi:MAG: hypothetical protein HY718_03080, partial [Planctomycetes bacterium]|nr:hypothetical protein [Planctomycetota bacterium]
AVGGLIGATTAVLVMGAAAGAARDETPSVVRAHQFEVVTADGKPALVLGMTANNTGTVTTLDGKGNKVVALGVTTGGEGTITTHNRKGRELVRAGATTSGEGVIITQDAAGRKLIEISVSTKGEPRVCAYKPDGTARATWP